MKFDDESTLYHFLDELDIKYRDHSSHLDVICPIHNDKEFGNAVYYKNSGILKCFHGACKFSGDVIDVYESVTGHSKIESMIYCKKLNGEDITELLNNKNTNFEYLTRKQKQIIQEKTKIEEKQIYLPDKIVAKFNPEDFIYTRKRGFTKEFIDHFQIRLATKGKYKDYMLIPVRSKQYNIKTFEARKIKEQEYLTNYFQMKGKLSILRDRFDELKNNLKLSFELDKETNIVNLYKNKVLFESKDKDLLIYFLQGKVLYPHNTLLNKPIIFNIDNLDRTQPLYLTEGLGSIPKIWSHISKNCSSLFGSVVSPNQIDILNEFEEIYLIPDFDKAGVGLVKTFAENIRTNWSIIFTEVEDDKPEYVETILDNDNFLGYASYINYITRHHSNLLND